MIKYFVNESKRTVIATIENTEEDLVRHITKQAIKHAHHMTLPDCVKNEALMPKCFRVEILCHPDDEFSVEEGKRRAKKKILKNYWRSRNKAMRRATDAMKDYGKRISEYSDFMASNIKDEK